MYLEVDIGSHMVLKLNSEGRVLLALGRMRIPGDDVGHFNQPTDVAWDRNGNVYVTDGYGNSRVLQFDTPHTIVIDGNLVYVGDGRTRGSQMKRSRQSACWLHSYVSQT